MNETRILVIDPDDNSRKFLVNILRNHDYAVSEAASGFEGLHKISEFTPDIITYDSALTDISIEVIIHKIRQEIHTINTPIVVFTNHLDPDEMNRFLQAGASDYFGKSGQAIIGFSNNITTLLEGTKSLQPEKTGGTLVVFISAKGGTGTSSICANVGMNLSRLFIKSAVALVDLVLPIGSLAILAGIKEPFNIVEVSKLPPEQITPEYLRGKMIKPGDWLFHLLPGSPDPDVASSLIVENTHHIIQMLQKTYDYVLVDLGRSFSRISLPIIQEADLIVMVLNNAINTVELTKLTIEYLIKQNINPDRIYPIINRAVGLEGLSIAEVNQMLGMDIRMTVPYMMSNLTLANNQNTPIAVKYPTETTNLVLTEIAIEISQATIRKKVENKAQ
ncbi:MAG: response regulator [Chloroflexota bacterium]